MALLLSMLPIYILGNLHCVGMCGPLVMMLGRHRYRHWYFVGRTFSFALAGLTAGALGEVLGVVLRDFQIPAITSFLFGGIILLIALFTFFNWSFPLPLRWRRAKIWLDQTLSLLMLKDQRGATFLFGFFTVALPCGQTLMVFSACALAGDSFWGFVNGFAFALLTSPSLVFAMQAHRWLANAKAYYRPILALLAFLVAILALCRGMAEMQWIPHLVLVPKYHIVLY